MNEVGTNIIMVRNSKRMKKQPINEEGYITVNIYKKVINQLTLDSFKCSSNVLSSWDLGGWL